VADTDPLIAELEKRLATLDAEIKTRQEERERTAGYLERVRALQIREQRASVDDMDTRPPTTQAQRLKFSQGKSKDDLVMFANDAGLTLRDLAKRVGCSGPLLTQARKGDRTIRRWLAERIRDATKSQKHPEGFPLTSWKEVKD
jgi:hypothetical protein